MATMTTERIKSLLVQLKAARAERIIRARTKNAADRGLMKVDQLISKLENKLGNSAIVAQPDALAKSKV